MLPPTLHNLTAEEVRQLAERIRNPFRDATRQMQIDSPMEQDLVDIYIPLAATLAQNTRPRKTALVVGVNGAQGAGKSTLCRLLQVVLDTGFDLNAACLSIDDLYMTRAERQQLAANVHPLFVTRGVPGTHDTDLGLRLLDQLRTLQAGRTLDLPVFDKAVDDRAPAERWQRITGPVDVVLFEGWCVGARPQPEEALQDPVNILERDEDSDRVWRNRVNRHLHEGYRRLFAELDMLLMLKVPGLESVLAWRGLQERKLATATQTGAARQIMDDTALQRFIMHYERLTRAILDEMPDRADLVLELNAEHQIDGVRINTLVLAGGR